MLWRDGGVVGKYRVTWFGGRRAWVECMYVQKRRSEDMGAGIMLGLEGGRWAVLCVFTIHEDEGIDEW